ncbi:hypothetical protein KJ359_009698 [Pestalotiopsis sp. 9143b]|nr:hypothetical protein KJ359_009698 [Pestalotiopsis sp. 9143b]
MVQIKPPSSSNSLTPFDWLMPRVYVSQILCFPTSDDSSFEVLKEGLRATAQDLPYLLGGVTTQDVPRGSLRLTDPYQTVDDLISREDLSGSLDYALLKAGHFPPSSLVDPAIRPPDAIPPLKSPAPVLRARLSSVRGGALLCVAVHHSTTDITGTGALLKLWAAHVRTKSSAAVQFERSWYDRDVVCGMVTMTADNAAPIGEVPSLIHMIKNDEQSLPKKNVPNQAVYVTRILHFPHARLQELKTAVNEQVRSCQGAVEWVSTGDVLTAILWSATVWMKEIGSDDEKTGLCTIAIPANFRAQLSPALPQNYLGSAFAMTLCSATRNDLLRASMEGPSIDGMLPHESMSGLARIASAVRSSLSRVNDANVKQVLRFVTCQSDITPIKFAPRHDGISLVSWADEGVYELDWGDALGRCDAVRLPRMAAKRDPIVLPRLPAAEGRPAGLEVIASYDEEMMERFCRNPLIRRFGSVRC